MGPISFLTSAAMFMGHMYVCKWTTLENVKAADYISTATMSFTLISGDRCGWNSNHGKGMPVAQPQLSGERASPVIQPHKFYTETATKAFASIESVLMNKQQ